MEKIEFECNRNMWWPNTHKKNSVNRENRTLNCNRNHCIKKWHKKIISNHIFWNAAKRLIHCDSHFFLCWKNAVHTFYPTANIHIFLKFHLAFKNKIQYTLKRKKNSHEFCVEFLQCTLRNVHVHHFDFKKSSHLHTKLDVFVQFCWKNSREKSLPHVWLNRRKYKLERFFNYECILDAEKMLWFYHKAMYGCGWTLGSEHQLNGIAF